MESAAARWFGRHLLVSSSDLDGRNTDGFDCGVIHSRSVGVVESGDNNTRLTLILASGSAGT